MNYFKKITNTVSNFKRSFLEMAVFQFELDDPLEANRVRNAISMRLTRADFHFGCLRCDESEKTTFWYFCDALDGDELLASLVASKAGGEMLLVAEHYINSEAQLADLAANIMRKSSLYRRVQVGAKNLKPIKVRRVGSLVGVSAGLGVM